MQRTMRRQSWDAGSVVGGWNQAAPSDPETFRLCNRILQHRRCDVPIRKDVMLALHPLMSTLCLRAPKGLTWWPAIS